MEYNQDWRQGIDFVKLRQERMARLEQKMGQYGLDALLSFSADHIRYMSGYRPLWWPIPTHALTRGFAMFVPGKGPVVFVPGPDLHRTRASMNWLPADQIKVMDHLEREEETKHTVNKQLQPAFSDMGIRSGRVGVEVVTPLIFEELQKAMPKIEWVDSNAFFRDVKFIKTPEEIKCMRQTAIMAEMGVEAGMRAIGAGVRDCEILGQALGRMYSFGMEVTQCSEIVASGEYTAPLVRFASDKPVRLGDLVFMDIGGCLNGYFSDHTRTVIYGKPNEQQKRVYRGVYEVMMVIHAMVKPGYTNRQLTQAIAKKLADMGFKSDGEKVRLSYNGHTIGISGNEAPRLHDDPPYEFAPGMVFAIEPGIYCAGVPGGGGVRLEDMILVTEDGNEILTRTPYCDKLLDQGYCGGPCAGCGA